MKQIKSISAIILLATMSLYFSACNDEGSNNDGNFGNSSITVINAKVENGENYNSTVKVVKAMAYTSFNQGIVIGTGTYSNSSFTIELPTTVDEQYLELILPNFGLGDNEGIKVSNPNVKTCSIDIYGFDKLNSPYGNQIVTFEYNTQLPSWTSNKDDRFHTYGEIIYVNGDVTITGSYYDSDNTHFNIFLKKGWNIMYLETEEVYNGNSYEKEIFHITNNAPNNMKWWAY